MKDLTVINGKPYSKSYVKRFGSVNPAMARKEYGKKRHLSKKVQRKMFGARHSRNFKCLVCGKPFESIIATSKYCSDKCSFYIAGIKNKVSTRIRRDNDIVETVRTLSKEMKLNPDTESRLIFLSFKMITEWGKHYPTLEIIKAVTLLIMKQEGYDIDLRLGNRWNAHERLQFVIETEKEIRRGLEISNLHIINRCVGFTEQERFRLSIPTGILELVNRILEFHHERGNPINAAFKAGAIYHVCKIVGYKITQDKLSDIFNITEVSLRNSAKLIDKKFKKGRLLYKNDLLSKNTEEKNGTSSSPSKKGIEDKNVETTSGTTPEMAEPVE